jgi:O-acetyl-ADP-ribose deacetylase (regulator of RNase III)
MHFNVVLVDINPKMVAAWRSTFEGNPEVSVVEGSMLDQRVDAWVTPTNSAAKMDGGLDGVIKKNIGAHIETRVQDEARRRFGGRLPVGHATCVSTGRTWPRFLISTPTMHQSSEDISDTLNVALACAAALHAAVEQNRKDPGSIRTLALPGLGANTGKVPVEICADLMWTGYNLLLENDFEDFPSVRAALEEQLGDLGPAKPKPAPKADAPTPKAAKPADAPKPPPAPKADVDFDDF